MRKTIHNKQCAHKHQRRGPRYRSNSQASSAADDEEEEIRFRAEAVGDGGAEEGTPHKSDGIHGGCAVELVVSPHALEQQRHHRHRSGRRRIVDLEIFLVVEDETSFDGTFQQLIHRDVVFQLAHAGRDQVTAKTRKLRAGQTIAPVRGSGQCGRVEADLQNGGLQALARDLAKTVARSTRQQVVMWFD